MPDDDAIVRRQTIIDAMLATALATPYLRWQQLPRLGEPLPWRPLFQLGRAPTEGDPDGR